MPSLAAFLIPVALLLPMPAADEAAPNASDYDPGVIVGNGFGFLGAAPDASVDEPAPVRWLMLPAPGDDNAAYQVRIEQRVIIRIAPQGAPMRENLTAQLPQGPQPRRLVERKIGSCVPMGGIIGVQPTSDNRLMLFMRDQRLIAANLEKACSARDYYSGFYVEPSRDGNLCVDRDQLQSRTGAKCRLSRIRQLVPASN